MTMTDQVAEECHSLQQEEWEVLEAIYPDYVSNDISERSFTLEVPVEFSESRSVSILDTPKLDSASDSSTSKSRTLSLSLLPPLLLHIVLPPAYPLHAPPEVLSMRATHLWMPHIVQLQAQLLGMWQEGEGVLYTWIEFIRSGQFLESLGLVKCSGTVEFHHATPHLLAPLLSSYEATARFNEFRQNSYPCSICLSHFKGSRCLRLSCGHIFCRSCLEDFWGLCIKEGDVGRVGCADPECVKEGRQADEEEVARIVTNEQVVRWRWLKEKAAMEKDPTIMHCPMVLCQKPVPKPRISDAEESGWQRLRTCSACSYSFCSFCKRTWHGPVSPCPISTYETLVLEYMALPEGSKERASLEQRFGRAAIAKLVATYQEEQLLKQWLADSATACPGCNVQIEKSLGCNHMTCIKCKQHFCYRCGAKLDRDSPYKHFSTPGQSCFNKLFDFNSGTDEWEPVEGFFIEEM